MSGHRPEVETDRTAGAPTPTVSVVVVTYNDIANLLNCLRSLLAQNYPAPATEVLVVDDGSTDGTADAVRARFPTVEVITKANEGADLSRNRGIEESTGEVLAFLDSDCVAHPDWLVRIADRLTRAPQTVVGGRVLHRGTFWQRVTGVADFGEFLGSGNREVRALPTCNMALGRTVLGETRFDPRLPRAGGDTLFSETLRRKGARLVFDPSIIVVHHPAVERGDMLRRARRYGRSFVEARKIDPSMRYAGFVRAGVPGVVVATFARALLDWWRLVRYRREAGFNVLEIPPAMFFLLLRRAWSLPEAVRALRSP